ncbi:MAG: phenylalanine--tRNA ligase subunit beta [Syntrophales bacterium]|nr:phenylalanine--tRNA ligase subunit beta [Syntrophales bacterium]
MQVSLRWLKDYVDIEIEPELLAAKLTMAGLEVEAVERREPPFKGVVAAKIIAIKPHPQADKLTLCDITDGEKIYSIVCGALNIMVGDVVPLAKTGAVLPGEITIRESRIRGELSKGMLCSEEELDIGCDSSGIMILSRLPDGHDSTENNFEISEGVGKTFTLGEELNEALALQDIIFTIAVTPNRSDCLSVIGIAREIAVLTGKQLRMPDIAITENEEDIERLTSVAIHDPDLCPRYTARVIKNALIKPSPLWMRLRLEAAGLRAINNIVDATNFVLLEMGQPLHAFDYRFLTGGRIVVRRSTEGETFTTLDGKERLLKAGILLICDGEKPVAVGGIMGGIKSEVRESTETILLESAYFNPASIRLSAKWLGMNTDASFRFERGVDPEGVIRAQNRAAQLMAKLSGGVICRGVIDNYPRKIETAKNIPLRVNRVCDIAGADIKADEIIPILEGLEMVVRKDEKGEGAYLVDPPTFRVDIDREIDLIEEIIRIRGYDSIPATLPTVSLTPVRRATRNSLEERVRGILTGNGYSEVISYSFVSPHWADRLGLPEGDDRRNPVRINNPLAEDQSVMRTTLLCGLLETMKRNAHMGSFDLKLFEVGKAFISRERAGLPLEKNQLCCLLTGMQNCEDWQSKRAADFYDLKGCAESIFADLGIKKVKFLPDLPEPFLHPGKSSVIMVGEKYAGFLGELHRNVLKILDLKNAAFVLEINLDTVDEAFSKKIAYREISKFPSITRDAAFLVSKQIDTDKMLGFVCDAGEELLETVHVFDVYDGKEVPEGMRSLGLRFVYRSYEKTLTDEEIAGLHSMIVKGILDLSGARIRGE